MQRLAAALALFLAATAAAQTVSMSGSLGSNALDLFVKPAFTFVKERASDVSLGHEYTF